MFLIETGSWKHLVKKTKYSVLQERKGVLLFFGTQLTIINVNFQVQTVFVEVFVII